MRRTDWSVYFWLRPNGRAVTLWLDSFRVTRMTKSTRPLLPADWVFYLSFSILGGSYVVLIVAMVIADLF